MPSARPTRSVSTHRLSLGVLIVFVLACTACKQAQKTSANAESLDQAGMWSNSSTELRTLNVSNAEIGELTKARDAGLSDPSCVALIKLARSRQKPFADGQAIADLLSAGSSEPTVLELAHLNQLGLWAGEARVLRLAGLSDKVILAVAQRRAQGLPVLSGGKLGELKNAGASEATILDFIQKGFTDQQASAYITQREAAAGGHGFVYQRRRRKS